MTDWTKDADGNYIDWTKPPYCRNGIIDFRLAGETFISLDQHSKRAAEYMKLVWREGSEQE